MDSKWIGQRQIIIISKIFIFLIFSISFVGADTFVTANKVFHKAEKDVVEISITIRNKRFVGSGFVVRDQATDRPVLVTAYHVVKGFKPDLSNISVSTKGENSLKIKKILSHSRKLDLILFELESYEGSGLKLAKHPVYDKASIYTVGYPGFRLTQDAKLVPGTSFHRPAHKTLAIITSLLNSALDGMSGSPILNSNGEVIGVFLSTHRMYGYHRALKSFYLDQFMSEPMPQRKWLTSHSIPALLYLRRNPFVSKTVLSQLQQLADAGSFDAQNMLSRMEKSVLFDAKSGVLLGSLALMNLYLGTFMLDFNTLVSFFSYATFVLAGTTSAPRCSRAFRYVRNKASLK